FAELDLDSDTGPSGFQATVQLFRDSNGNGVYDSTETLATATTNSSGRALIQKALTSGDYFVRVTGNPFPNYTLQVHGDTVPGVINLGDSLSNSKNIGQQLGESFQGESMGAGDPSDTFKL